MIGFNRGIMTSVSGGTRYVANDSNPPRGEGYSQQRWDSSNRGRSGFYAEVAAAHRLIENDRRSGAFVVDNPTPPGAINSIGSGSLYPSSIVARIEACPDLLHGCTAADTPCGEGAEDACIICHEHAATVALVPCGHMFTCIACTRGLAKKECPTCRTAVTSALKVFK